MSETKFNTPEEIAAAASQIKMLLQNIETLEDTGGKLMGLTISGRHVRGAEAEMMELIREVFPKIEMIVAARMRVKCEAIRMEFPNIEFGG